MSKIPSITLAVLMTLGFSASAQAQDRTPVSADTGNPTPMYRINVLGRTTRAVSYRHRSGSTKIDFQGTDLMPDAAGEAKVESKRGALEIEVELSGLSRPTSIGKRGKLDVTTDLQAFALIVTAEPYYAVRRPSNVWSSRTLFARTPALE